MLYLSLSRFQFRIPMILHPVLIDLFSFSPNYPINRCWLFCFPANLLRYLNQVLLLLKPSYIQPRFSCKHVCNCLYGWLYSSFMFVSPSGVPSFLLKIYVIVLLILVIVLLLLAWDTSYQGFIKDRVKTIIM